MPSVTVATMPTTMSLACDRSSTMLPSPEDSVIACAPPMAAPHSARTRKPTDPLDIKESPFARRLLNEILGLHRPRQRDRSAAKQIPHQRLQACRRFRLGHEAVGTRRP